jgi:hypothetical protein
MTTLSLFTIAAPRTQRDQAVTKINFVPAVTITDRDFDVARHVKLLGVSAAAIVTLITTALFLFM